MAKYKVTVQKQDGTFIPENEPVFVLRAQDILAPIAVRFYADLVEWATNNWAKADEIEQFAKDMVKWPTRKLPD